MVLSNGKAGLLLLLPLLKYIETGVQKKEMFLSTCFLCFKTSISWRILAAPSSAVGWD